MKRRVITKPDQNKLEKMWDSIIATLEKGNDVKITIDRQDNIILQEMTISRIKYSET